MASAWYKNAVIYSLDVRTFQDSDGDGVGDFDGLRRRLDYLDTLGVTALWLLPFFPSPGRDGGYDVTDHLAVDERLGGIAAFIRFAKEAGERGLRLIVDLPMNHTSREHRWFQEARADRGSPYRDYYIWADEPPPSSPEQIVFRGDKPDPWTYDEEAGQFYLHRFYEDEPDLNHASPAVRDEMLKTLEFWLGLGVSGIRVDAAPYIAKKSAADPAAHGPHTFLRQMHERVVAERHDAMLMAEADVKPAELGTYFGDGAEMQVLFDFLVNNYFFLALAREEAEPLVKVLGMQPRRPPGGQWAKWVRNHDELDLERLTTRERADVMEAFAPDEEMQIYGRGIRRRFPPMVGGDRCRVELAYALMFALPGTPIVRYGEEIGMGDDLSLPGRQAVRTPMQWSPDVNGGFSTAASDDLVVAATEDGDHGFPRVNVADQQVEPSSLLSRMQLLIGVRRQCPELGEDEPDIIQTGHAAVLGLKYGTDDDVLVTLHNLGREPCRVRLQQLEEHCHLFDVLADRRYRPPANGTWEMELSAYGYRWFRARSTTTAEQGPSAEAATGALQEKPK